MKERVLHIHSNAYPTAGADKLRTQSPPLLNTVKKYCIRRFVFASYLRFQRKSILLKTLQTGARKSKFFHIYKSTPMVGISSASQQLKHFLNSASLGVYCKAAL